MVRADTGRLFSPGNRVPNARPLADGGMSVDMPGWREDGVPSLDEALLVDDGLVGAVEVECARRARQEQRGDVRMEPRDGRGLKRAVRVEEMGLDLLVLAQLVASAVLRQVPGVLVRAVVPFRLGQTAKVTLRPVKPTVALRTKGAAQLSGERKDAVRRRSDSTVASGAEDALFEGLRA